MRKIFTRNAIVALFICLPLTLALSQVEIRTVADLRAVGMSGEYILMNDIDLADVPDWRPIGVEEVDGNWDLTPANVNFGGMFDGNGYAIKNITITDGQDFTGGLFARIARAANNSSPVGVKNLRLENVNIKGSGTCGGISGTLFGNGQGANAKPVIIENVSVTGRIQGTGEVGGISGRVNNAPVDTIRNCYVNAEIIGDGTGPYNPDNASQTSVGGLIGCMNSGQGLVIQNSYVAGSIGAATDVVASNSAGGMIGSIKGPRNNSPTILIQIENSALVTDNISGFQSGVVVGGETTSEYLAGTLNLTIANSYIPVGLSLPADGSNTIVVTGVETKTAEDFKAETTYKDGLGWDFENVWGMKEDMDFPILIFKSENHSNAISLVQTTDYIDILPTENGVLINTKKSDINLAIFNVLGGLEYSKSNIPVTSHVDLRSGLYIIEVQSDNQKVNTKFLVK